MKKYKVKVSLTALVMLIVFQLILLLSIYNAAYRIKQQNIKEDFYYECYNIEYSVENKLNIIESAMKAMENAEITDYTESSTVTLNEDETEAVIKKADDYINWLDMPSEIFGKIIIIGTAFGKVSYVKDIGKEGYETGTLPNMTQLSFANMTEWDDAKTETWRYYSQGTLFQIFNEGMEKNQTNISSEISISILRMLELLDGQIVLTSSSLYNGSQIFVTINPDFISDCVGEDNNTTVALMKGNQLIWSNNSFTDRYYIQQNKSTNGTWKSKYNNKDYNNKYVDLGDTGGSLIMSVPVNVRTEGIDFNLNLLQFSIAAIASGTIVAFIMTAVMIFGIKTVSKNFNEQFNKGSYRKIEYSKKITHKLPVYWRMVIIFCISVLLPTAVSGFYYQHEVSLYTSYINNSYLEKVSYTVTSSIDQKIDYTFFNSALFPQSQLVNYLKNTNSGKALIKTKLDSMLSEADLFTFYSLFNSRGEEIYSTKGSADYGKINPEYQDILKSETGKRKYYYITDTGKTDSLDNIIPAIVYPVYSDGDEPEVIGYLALYLKLSRYYELRPGIGHEFIITDKDGKYIFSSINAGDKKENLALLTASFDSDGSAVSGEYQIIRKTDDKIGGYVYVYNDLSYYLEQSAHILSNNYLVLAVVTGLILLASIILSKRIITPLRQIDADMQNITDISAISPIKYRSRDEISALVESYNRMVARMGTLIEENARRINRENELLAIKSKAELRMLQQQINPHLLYNTLEFISYNANREGKSAAGDMAMALADFFRYTTSLSEDTVFLSDEIKHVKNYIEIHKLRYGERFTAEYDIEAEAENCRVMKFIIQPFAENVFKYGIANKIRDALIKISAAVKDGSLIITIYDNGIGMRTLKLEALVDNLEKYKDDIPEDIRNNQEGGIGMLNVYRRLRMYYGKEATINVQSEFMRGMTVTIRIPAIIKQK